MKTSYLKTVVVYIICLLYIILFTYAAVSKLLDFQNFQIQIGQSPLLSAFATPVSYGVPIVEIGLALTLMFSNYRLLGLYGSFILMTMFTAYIFIILNFSSFIPCSCGGILEDMSWTQHLIFNIAFVVLSGIAIILLSKTRFVYGYLIINLISGIIIITVLFLMSEDIIQHRNNFVRRLPDHVHKVHDRDLKFNSYYFAGAEKGKIYLGNITSPLLLTEIDTLLRTKREIVVKINNLNLPFRSLQIKVQSSFFYITDGTVPCLFKGKTSNWSAYQIPIKTNSFASPVIIDSISMAYRTHNAATENVLGVTNFGHKGSSQINSSLLQKQIDGVFDVDGILTFDSFTKKVIYIYYYRNQFIVTDPKLNLSFRGKTIDTISKAQIKVAYNTDRDERKMAAPPLVVNKNAFAYNGLLFVNSALMGKFEDARMWKQASLIDIYDINNKTYLVSFYLYNIDNKKAQRFMVYNNNFYALVGTHIVSYKLSNLIVNHYSKK